MALRKNYELSVDFTKRGVYTISIPEQITKVYQINNAYIKIINLEGGKEQLALQIGIFKEDRKTLVLIKQYTFIPLVDTNAPNFIEQGYEFLKLLPEFEDAIDC